MDNRRNYTSKTNASSRSAPGAASAQKEPRRGEICPHCGREKLDYDGCLNLTCKRCGYMNAGAFT